MTTIYEIAKILKLSPSTVARALRGSGYCSEEKKKLILETAKRLNYIPSYLAKSLKSNKTNKLLLCIPDISNPFYFGMINGLSEVATKYDYLPLLCPTKGDIKNELKMIANLQSGYGDGMVFVSFDFNEENILAVNSCYKPIVLTNNYQSSSVSDSFDCVYVDTRKGIRLATQHFISQGISKIGYIGGNPKTQTGRERYEGFLTTMQDANKKIDKRFLQVGDFTIEAGELAMEHFLKESDQPDALVVANDLMAIGVINCCRQYHIKVPEELAVIGMDNSVLSDCLELSSIKMHEEEIGKNAAELLMDSIINGKHDKKVIRLEPELVVRSSSKKYNSNILKS